MYLWMEICASKILRFLYFDRTLWLEVSLCGWCLKGREKGSGSSSAKIVET